MGKGGSPWSKGSWGLRLSPPFQRPVLYLFLGSLTNHRSPHPRGIPSEKGTLALAINEALVLWPGSFKWLFFLLPPTQVSGAPMINRNWTTLIHPKRDSLIDGRGLAFKHSWIPPTSNTPPPPPFNLGFFLLGLFLSPFAPPHNLWFPCRLIQNLTKVASMWFHHLGLSFLKRPPGPALPFFFRYVPLWAWLGIAT